MTCFPRYAAYVLLIAGGTAPAFATPAAPVISPLIVPAMLPSLLPETTPLPLPDPVRAMIAETLPGMAGPRTAMGDSIGLAIRMFESSQAPEKVLILLTDGNDTASRMPPDRAAGIARDNRIRIHTVGIGDPQATGEDRLDTATLQKIAAETGGRYFFGQDQAQLAEIYATLDRITPANHETLTWRPKRELFHYPLGVAIGLVLVSQVVMLLLSSVRRAHARRAAAESPS